MRGQSYYVSPFCSLHTIVGAMEKNVCHTLGHSTSSTFIGGLASEELQLLSKIVVASGKLRHIMIHVDVFAGEALLDVRPQQVSVPSLAGLVPSPLPL